MRKVVIFNDCGEMFECDYIDKCNPSDSNFINRYFVSRGKIIAIPFIETMIKYLEYYEYKEEEVNKLKNIKDDFKIYMIYNSFVEEDIDDFWKNNKFLSNIFGIDVYAENITLFVSEEDLNGFKEVDEKEYLKFTNCVVDIINVIKNITSYDYFKKMTYKLSSEDDIIIEDRKELEDMKNNYDEGVYDLFTDIQEVNNDGTILLRKNGIMMIANKDNECEVYFDSVRDNITVINKLNYVEKVC